MKNGIGGRRHRRRRNRIAKRFTYYVAHVFPALQKKYERTEFMLVS